MDSSLRPTRCSSTVEKRRTAAKNLALAMASMSQFTNKVRASRPHRPGSSSRLACTGHLVTGIVIATPVPIPWRPSECGSPVTSRIARESPEHADTGGEEAGGQCIARGGTSAAAHACTYFYNGCIHGRWHGAVARVRDEARPRHDVISRFADGA